MLQDELQQGIPTRYKSATRGSEDLDPEDFMAGLFEAAKSWRSHRKPKNGRSHERFRSSQNSLSWCTIVPEGPLGDSLLQELGPLLEIRGPNVLRFPDLGRLSNETTGAKVAKWIEKHDEALSEYSHIMVAGPTHIMPFSLYAQLSSWQHVGVLSLDKNEAYGRYARRVVQAEDDAKEQKQPKRPVTFFGSSRGDAQGLSCAKVLTPIANRVDKNYSNPIRRLLAHEATKSQLINELSGPEGSSLLFAACHGVMDHQPTASYTGALVDDCNNTFSAQTITENAPLLNNGIAILSACASGGIPRARRWAQITRRNIPTPEFDQVSQLPKTWLSSEGGPLAIISHLDILFTWGLSTRNGDIPEQGNNPGVRVLSSLCQGLLQGQTVGEAMTAMMKLSTRYKGLLEDSTWAAGKSPELPSEKREIRERLLCDFMRWHDLGGWIVLGDPMVRLEGVSQSVKTKTAPVTRGGSDFGESIGDW